MYNCYCAFATTDSRCQKDGHLRPSPASRPIDAHDTFFAAAIRCLASFRMKRHSRPIASEAGRSSVATTRRRRCRRQRTHFRPSPRTRKRRGEEEKALPTAAAATVERRRRTTGERSKMPLFLSLQYSTVSSVRSSSFARPRTK